MAFNQSFIQDSHGHNLRTSTSSTSLQQEQSQIQNGLDHSISYSHAANTSLNSWVLFSPSTEFDSTNDILSSSYNEGSSELAAADNQFDLGRELSGDHDDVIENEDEDDNDSLIDSLKLALPDHSGSCESSDLNSRIDQWRDEQNIVSNEVASDDLIQDFEENIASWDFDKNLAGLSNKKLKNKKLFKNKFYGDDLFNDCDISDLQNFQKTSKKLSSSLKRSNNANDIESFQQQQGHKHKRFSVSRQLIKNRQCYSQILSNNYNDISINSSNLNNYLDKIFLKSVPQGKFSLPAKSDNFWENDLNNDLVSSINSSNYTLSTNSIMFSASQTWGEVN